MLKERGKRMLFLYFWYLKTFLCIFIDLCTMVSKLCTLHLSSFFALNYLRIYFQTLCRARLKLHVRKYKIRTQLERWMLCTIWTFAFFWNSEIYIYIYLYEFYKSYEIGFPPLYILYITFCTFWLIRKLASYVIYILNGSF